MMNVRKILDTTNEDQKPAIAEPPAFPCEGSQPFAQRRVIWVRGVIARRHR
jgi:hypothetical protein